MCCLRDQVVQMSTTHSSLFCISHKAISHRAAAAPGPEVHRECPMTQFPSLPLLATNLGNATERNNAIDNALLQITIALFRTDQFVSMYAGVLSCKSWILGEYSNSHNVKLPSTISPVL